MDLIMKKKRKEKSLLSINETNRPMRKTVDGPLIDIILLTGFGIFYNSYLLSEAFFLKL